MQAVYGIFYKMEYHKEFLEAYSKITLENMDTYLKYVCNEHRGHLYIKSSLIIGRETYLNFHPMNLKKNEIGFKDELTLLNKIHDLLIKTMDYNTLHLGWSVVNTTDFKSLETGNKIEFL